VIVISPLQKQLQHLRNFRQIFNAWVELFGWLSTPVPMMGNFSESLTKQCIGESNHNIVFTITL